MSRITNDTDTIQQVFSFGLVSVISGVMLIVWIGISMFQASVVYALLSLSVVPIMMMTANSGVATSLPPCLTKKLSP